MTVRRVVVDHVDLLVRDLEASRRFYQAILEPLSYGIMAQSDTSVSFGVAGADDFGINHSDTPTSQAHVAFVSPSRAAVDAFYANALATACCSVHTNRFICDAAFHNWYKRPRRKARSILVASENNPSLM